MSFKTTHHAILGNLTPAQGPFATYFHEDRDDFDLALYTEGVAWVIKIEIDYISSITRELETVEKELAVDVNYLKNYGRGYFTNKFEEVYDKIAATQLMFLDHTTIVSVRNGIMKLMDEAYARMDAGEDPFNVLEV